MRRSNQALLVRKSAPVSLWLKKSLTLGSRSSSSSRALFRALRSRALIAYIGIISPIPLLNLRLMRCVACRCRYYVTRSHILDLSGTYPTMNVIGLSSLPELSSVSAVDHPSMHGDSVAEYILN
jgi:hypothetical protein